MNLNLNLTFPKKLFDYLCSLDFYRDFNDGPFDSEADDLQYRASNENLEEIPFSFDSPEFYIQKWEKLFLTECRAQILKEAQQNTKHEIIILLSVSRQETVTTLNFERESDTDITYSPNDILLVTKEDPSVHQLEHILARVDEINPPRKISIKTTIKSPFIPNSREAKVADSLFDRSRWYAVNICNLGTLMREYQALHSIGDLSLRNFLLTPEEYSKETNNYFDIPSKLKEKIFNSYNSSQIEAITESLKKEGVTLIQGPPGTGKTTTVLAIVSVLLNSSSKLGLSTSKKGESDMMDVETQEIDLKIKKKNWMKTMPWIYQNNYKNWLDDRDPVPDGPTKERVVQLLPKMDESVIKPAKILICGPSNASIDQIVRIILEKGLLNDQGDKYVPSLVRIGPNAHPSLKSVTLEYLVDKEKEIRGSKNAEHNVIRNEILNKVQIVCSTLSSAGSATLTQLAQKFDTVVIDEAAQAVEISTLIPLKYECKRLILIGDPKQLPATIFSRTCERYKYDRSLFQRLQSQGYPVHMLNTQYRMNPTISKIISTNFYDSKLNDASNILDIVGQPKLYKDPVLQPFSVFTVKGKEEFDHKSYKNVIEASIVVQLYRYIRTTQQDISVQSIGIITPYSSQVSLIRKLIEEADQALECEVEVNSVDGFQGREKDIIIFSTVRSQFEEEPTVSEMKTGAVQNKDGGNTNLFEESKDKMDEEQKKETKKPEKKSIGFLRDERRMNVSLSRARLCLIVVGDSKRLQFSINPLMMGQPL